MLKFIFKRLLEALPTLFILITFSFFSDASCSWQPVHLRTCLSTRSHGKYRSEVSLNEPLHKQYFLYLEIFPKAILVPLLNIKINRSMI